MLEVRFLALALLANMTWLAIDGPVAPFLRMALIVATIALWSRAQKRTDGLLTLWVLGLASLASAIFAYQLTLANSLMSTVALAVTPLLMASTLTRQDLRTLETVLVYSSPSSALLSVLLNIAGLLHRSPFRIVGTSLRLRGLSNPAHFAIYALVGFAVAISRSLQNERRFRPWIVLNLICVVLSGGRTAIATAALILLVALSFRGQQVRRVWRRLVGILALGLPLLWLLAPALIIRLRAMGLDDSGRSGVWRVFVGAIRHGPYFGHGAGTAQSLIPESYSKFEWHSPHNEFLRLAYEFGPQLGVVLATAYLGLFIRRLNLVPRGNKRIPWAYMLGYVIFFIYDNPLSYAPLAATLTLGLRALTSSHSLQQGPANQA